MDGARRGDSERPTDASGRPVARARPPDGDDRGARVSDRDTADGGHAGEHHGDGRRPDCHPDVGDRDCDGTTHAVGHDHER